MLPKQHLIWIPIVFFLSLRAHISCTSSLGQHGAHIARLINMTNRYGTESMFGVDLGRGKSKNWILIVSCSATQTVIIQMEPSTDYYDIASDTGHMLLAGTVIGP